MSKAASAAASSGGKGALGGSLGKAFRSKVKKQMIVNSLATRKSILSETGL